MGVVAAASGLQTSGPDYKCSFNYIHSALSPPKCAMIFAFSFCLVLHLLGPENTGRAVWSIRVRWCDRIVVNLFDDGARGGVSSLLLEIFRSCC